MHTNEASCCLRCGYDLQSLATPATCPECGELNDPAVDRAEVCRLLELSGAALAWQMLKPRRGLPVGWWWCQDASQDAGRARRRLFVLASLVLAVLVFVCLSSVRRETRTTFYEYPVGQPQARKVRGSTINYFGTPAAAVAVAPSPGHALDTEISTSVVFKLSVSNIIGGVLPLPLVLTFWLMIRWVWWRSWLGTFGRGLSAAEKSSADYAARALMLPFALLLSLAILQLAVAWLLHLGGGPDLGAMSFAVLLFAITVLPAVGCIPAIRSDRSGRLFARRALALLTMFSCASVGVLAGLVIQAILITLIANA